MNGSALRGLARRLLAVALPGSLATSPLDVERAEQMFYISYLRPRMVVFDVGAHVGELTLLFSRFVGTEGSVHAFEPNPSTFDRLQMICDLAGRKNTILNMTAVADTDGTGTLHVYDREHSGWNSLAKRPLRDYGIDVDPLQVQEVPTATIDSYCEENGVQTIDLLKIDVEGAEYQVLRGAGAMLAQKRILCCVFEFGQTTLDMGNSPDDIEAYLRRFSYRLDNVVKGDPVFPGKKNVKGARFSMHVARPNR